MNQPDYVLGHSDHELGRLRRQAALLESTTREYLAAAGLAPGMRVLDVGSGAGDVAMLAAELTTPGGRVIGTDTAAAAVSAASAAASAAGLSDIVHFRNGDPAALTFDEPFDAIVGRYVLVFQADPAAMLRRVSRHLAPGGIVVFHEPDWCAVRSSPPAPTYDRCCRWIIETVDRARTSWNMADRLHRTFTDAGLPAPTLSMRTFIGVGIAAEVWLRAVADIVETLLPTMEALGSATAAEVGLETLAERLIDEIRETPTTLIGRSEVAAWCRGGESS
ncbi:methyltransferase domain-containing protein [Mycobacterium sp. CVI_P3]|uniref:Methyltransferase domain-containing protein n=1 Tax=Mycobacterium pinniadriaticum TaxID=2994102 RepID=A0ABT3SD69_9MYCO|nr:methyltransferase domain-containing protein [Mycobacterium pinniadriaticum]MCX2931032.1 methyltransferase domain-containing protein [Mycobacterium pinniadriaticum]MCX2937456.1 methyltransferase domain-containing protein [Mycobacterium pinniadriaticum]